MKIERHECDSDTNDIQSTSNFLEEPTNETGRIGNPRNDLKASRPQPF